MDSEDQKVAPAPQKFSRYRSVRIAAGKKAILPAPQLPPADTKTEKKDEGIKRSMSRYRHGGSKSVEGRATQTLPAAKLLISAKPPSLWSGDYTEALELESDLKNLEVTLTKEPSSGDSYSQEVGHSGEEQRRHTRKARNGDPRLDLSPEKSVPHIQPPRPDFGPRHTREATNGHSRVDSSPEKPVPQVQSLRLNIGHRDAPKFSHDIESATYTDEKASRAALPGIDAPLSAVNAGERRVRVKFQKDSATFPVTPSTTVEDILALSAKEFPAFLDVKPTTLVEHYRDLGLERPLRLYEYVRDVLNSWDHDDQNYLILLTSTDESNTPDLNLKGAPKQQPSNATVDLYHSQKPDTWDKRWITLRGDGQVILSKEEGSTDTKNICHMSDFDVYTPTPRQMKRLCPPKKYCLAIKSQQKSAMFLTTANFVHFFATRDRVMYDTWYRAVQEWRTWYLVHVMGNGQKQAVPNTGLARKLSNARSIQGRAMSLSSTKGNGSPYREGRTAVKSRPSKERSAPPVSFPKNFSAPEPSSPFKKDSLLSAQASLPMRSPEHGAFTMNALDRSISHRQKAPEHSIGSPLLDMGPSGLTRSSSRRQPQAPMFAPLVDLTPQYQDLPHHVKKGHGVTVDKIPAGGLVEIATTPKVPIPVPPATTNIRPKTANAAALSSQQSTSPPIAPLIDGAHDPLREDHPDAFTGGLLAQLGDIKRTPTQRTQRTRAATTGNRQAGEPLLDVQIPSKYVPGSLLAQVERTVPEAGPIIDRAKRRTGIIATTGEGL